MDQHYTGVVRKLKGRVQLAESKLDDQEMHARKWNVRIENIAFTGEPKAETDSQLLEKVKVECKKVGIDLLDNDIARCHRSSAPSRRDWAVRKRFQAAYRHAHQNKIRFSCSNDLTKMRHAFMQDDSSTRQWSRNLQRWSAIPGKSAIVITALRSLPPTASC